MKEKTLTQENRGRPVAQHQGARTCERKKVVSPMQKRRMVREVTGAGLCNVRRACKYLKLNESSYYYREKEVAPYQIKLRKRIIHLSWEFPRYGYRRIRALLDRESWRVRPKTGATCAPGRRPESKNEATQT